MRKYAGDRRFPDLGEEYPRPFAWVMPWIILVNTPTKGTFVRVWEE